MNELKLGSLNIEGAKEILKTYINDYETLGVATLDEDNNPASSYAVYIKKNNKFYILISETAPHYNNIINNENVSIIFLEDEKEALNPFFRKRLNYLTKAKISNDELIKEEFIKKHGAFSKMLMNNMDFLLFELTIVKGKLILGAGKAYFINENNEITSQDTGKTTHLNK